MKLNRRMQLLLQRQDLKVLSLGAHHDEVALVEDGDSVFLKEAFLHRSVEPSQFPDLTGFEAFINHIHLPYNGSRQSLRSALNYCADLAAALNRLNPGVTFRIILGVTDQECTVRFHRVRDNEEWVSQNLEGYEEAILVWDFAGRPLARCWLEIW